MRSLQFKGIVGHPIHGFGYQSDPVGHRYNGFQHHPAAQVEADSLPPETNNIVFVPPRWSQGNTGSCTGHGKAGSVTTTLAAHGNPLPMPLSPRLLYLLGRAVDRSSPSIPLRDEGAQPNSLVRALGIWGCVLESEVDGGLNATSDGYVAHLEAHINDEPKLGELETAGKRIFVGFNAISDNAPDKLLQFRKALATGHAIGVAVDAGSEAFQGFTGNGVLSYTGPDPDHWVFIADYRTTAAGKFQFLLINSWGLGLWTPDGTAWVDEAFVVRGCFNSLVANVGV
jgi:hypothetical protein